MILNRRAFLGGVTATVLSLRAAAAAKPADGFTTLEARAGSIRMLPEPAGKTAVWTYNGHVPGPLLRVKAGDEVKVRLVNKLAQPTSLRWHGVRIANAMAGVVGLTQPPVQPGDSFDYRFTAPDSGLYWYHPHVWPVGAEQIGRGLYGALIVDEAAPPEVDEDLLVVLDDWSLDAEGQIKGDFLDTAQARRTGRIGPLVTVDSKPAPKVVAVRPGARLRIRLLNVCSARITIVTFDGMPATVIALDGQPSELFRPMAGTLPIGPGSRFEVMVDVPADASHEARLILRGDGEPDRPLLALKIAGKPHPARPALTKLPENPRLPTRIPLEKSLKRDLAITAYVPIVPPGSKNAETPPATAGGNEPLRLWAIDGFSSDGFSGKPLFTVPHGGAVTLAFVNRTAFPQQMHVHGHVFRVLHDLDDGWEPYWRESILVGPGKTKHVAFIADNPGKWAVESLILDHQVTGLAAWFEVA